MPEITESEKLRRRIESENRILAAQAAEKRAKELAEKERRLDNREKRREIREWITLGISVLALVLSILSLIWQHSLH